MIHYINYRILLLSLPQLSINRLFHVTQTQSCGTTVLGCAEVKHLTHPQVWMTTCHFQEHLADGIYPRLLHYLMIPATNSSLIWRRTSYMSTGAMHL